jgi:hypothetical protein
MAAKGKSIPLALPRCATFKAQTEMQMLVEWTASSFLAIENPDVRALRSLVNLGKNDDSILDFVERA